jgi:hypothetical protein
VTIPPLLLQSAGSLVAILALAGLAWWLRLGGTPRLASEADVAQFAGEVEDGFAPVAVAIDAEGGAALASDAEGRIMLLRRHGNRFAGRVLTAQAHAAHQDQPVASTIMIDCGEARFGKTFLTIPDADAWAEAINRVSVGSHA